MGESSLLEKIEECRQEMLSLSESYEFTSKPVIDTSQKLDDLLNKYQDSATINS
ncbi:MAG TPA: aspartyl-phosphate phosphatase Spo0E family protein [Virgibacillus sp.]|nr:aspartyl-phosphate phosphatase Spo0E family protein [Virgibacillus sp.]